MGIPSHYVAPIVLQELEHINPGCFTRDHAAKVCRYVLIFKHSLNRIQRRVRIVAQSDACAQAVVVITATVEHRW